MVKCIMPIALSVKHFASKKYFLERFCPYILSLYFLFIILSSLLMDGIVLVIGLLHINYAKEN